MSTRARGRSSSLASALVAAGVILSFLWWLAGRAPAEARSGLTRGGALACQREEPPIQASAALATSSDLRRTPVEPAGTNPAEQPGLATLNGRLQVDGFAPYQGKVLIREVDRDRTRVAQIDLYGRFFVEDVPAARLSLSFEMEWSAERQLLLPSVMVTPAPGETEVLDLDWTTRHVNVQVLEEGGAASPARVDLQGPDYAASFETDERGKAKLSLVGSGSFSLLASLPSGRSVGAALELHEGDELETVLIAAAPAR